MASAVAAGGDSGGLSLDGGCQPSSPQSISCGGDGQVAHSDGGSRSQPRPSTVNQHSAGPYRGPSMLREPGAGPGPTSRAPGRGGFFLHLRGTDDLLGQGVGGVRSHRVRDGRGGEGGGGGRMSTPNESSTTVSKRPPPSPHLLAATALPPPCASRCLSRTPRRSSPAVLSPPLPPPPRAEGSPYQRRGSYCCGCRSSPQSSALRGSASSVVGATAAASHWMLDASSAPHNQSAVRARPRVPFRWYRASSPSSRGYTPPRLHAREVCSRLYLPSLEAPPLCSGATRPRLRPGRHRVPATWMPLRNLGCQASAHCSPPILRSEKLVRLPTSGVYYSIPSSRRRRWRSFISS
mmetsp:Transcript_29698/g.74239  ORF Transcript_29698/g.74239 Transcript_29698/m.74239 type:complete len:350 (+) Transcript_29698:539-1588(+)